MDLLYTDKRGIEQLDDIVELFLSYGQEADELFMLKKRLVCLCTQT